MLPLGHWGGENSSLHFLNEKVEKGFCSPGHYWSVRERAPEVPETPMPDKQQWGRQGYSALTIHSLGSMPFPETFSVPDTVPLVKYLALLCSQRDESLGVRRPRPDLCHCWHLKNSVCFLSPLELSDCTEHFVALSSYFFSPPLFCQRSGQCVWLAEDVFFP